MGSLRNTLKFWQTILLFLAVSNHLFATEYYNFKFRYTPGIFREYTKFFVPSWNESNTLDGTLQIAADKECLFAVTSYKKAVVAIEWIYPHQVVYYCVSKKFLKFSNVSRDRLNLIPLWLPTNALAERFIVNSAECHQEGDLCIVTPYDPLRTAAVLESTQGDHHKITLPGKGQQFWISWDSAFSKLKNIDIVMGYGDAGAASSSKITHFTKVSYVGIPPRALKTLDWQEIAKKANQIQINGQSVKYDPKKGSVWNQYLANAKAWKDHNTFVASLPKPPLKAPLPVISWVFGIGVVVLIAGIAKVLLNAIKKS